LPRGIIDIYKNIEQRKLNEQTSKSLKMRNLKRSSITAKAILKTTKLV